MKKIFLMVFVLSIITSAQVLARTKNLSLDPYFQEQIKAGLIQESSDTISGKKSFVISSHKVAKKKIDGWNFSIVQTPHKSDEYRYILFAWKQKAGKTLMIHLANKSEWNHALCYSAGPPKETLLPIQLSAEPPEKWVIVIRDLYEDMIQAQVRRGFNHNNALIHLTITGIALLPWDSQFGLWDSIYFGSNREELETTAKEIRKKGNQEYNDPVMDLKNQIVSYNTKSSEWEKAIETFASKEAHLTPAEKKFFAEDMALSNAWLAEEKFANGDYQSAQNYFDKSAKYFDIAGVSKTKWGMPYLQDLLKRRKSLGKITPEYSHKVALLLIPEVQTDSLEASSDSGDIRRFRTEWGVIKQTVELYSGGHLSLDVQFHPYNGKYTKLANGSPDILSIKPYPSEILKKLAADSDVIGFYYPTYTTSHGGVDKILLDPPNLYSPKRGLLGLNKGITTPDDFMLPFHEYIHSIEHVFGFTTSHSFRNAPEYATDQTGAELSYYEKLFKTQIPNWKAFSL